MMRFFIVLFNDVIFIAFASIANRNHVVLVRAVVLASSAVLLTAGFNTVEAAGATRRFEANPGEIVLLRDVPKGPAARPGYPGKALLLDVGPVQQTKAIPEYSGLVEISDSDAAVINTGASSYLARPDTPPHSNFHSQTLPGGSVLRNGMAGRSVMQSVGNIRRVTEDIDKQIKAVVQPLDALTLSK